MGLHSQKHLHSLVIFGINQPHAASLCLAVGLQLKEEEKQKGPLCRFPLPLLPQYKHYHRHTGGHGRMRLQKLGDGLKMYENLRL
jgi:hypothetical protein